MNKALLRTGGIFAAFIIGYFLPELKSLEWMIRWIIIIMLFMTFLKVRFHQLNIEKKHLYLLFANIAIAMGLWGALKISPRPDLAVMAFFIAITPTATAAPVIMGFLKGRVEFMVSSLIVTTFGVGCLLPLLMPVAIGSSAPGLIGHMAASVSMVLALPLILALFVRNLVPNAEALAIKLGKFQFPLWVFNLTLVSASGSAFIRQHAEFTGRMFLELGLLAFVICILNFTLGYLIGRPGLGRECSQSLGQKNTALTIFLALTYSTPLAALSVTFYVVFHNLWNALQIQRQGRKDHLAQKLLDKEMTVAFREES